MNLRNNSLLSYFISCFLYKVWHWKLYRSLLNLYIYFSTISISIRCTPCNGFMENEIDWLTDWLICACVHMCMRGNIVYKLDSLISLGSHSSFKYCHFYTFFTLTPRSLIQDPKFSQCCCCNFEFCMMFHHVTGIIITYVLKAI
jgi:hypothetical protein